MSTTNPTTGADIIEISGSSPISGAGAGATGAAVPANAELTAGGAAGGAGNLTAITVKAASTAAVATDTSLVTQSLIRNVQMAIAAAGVQQVGVVGNAGAAFDGATGSAVPANALLNGARAATANPTNASGGNNVALMADKAGRLVVTEGNVRELIGVQQTAYGAVTTEQTIITSGGAGVFCDLIGLVITTVNAAAATLTIRDATGGTTRMILNYPNTAAAPTTPLVLQFNPPIPQAAAANNWTIQASASATGFNITAVFAKNL